LPPDDKKSAFPGIPWREISGFRNILVHNYLGDIDPLKVSVVIEKHLQPLEECIRAMLAQLKRRVLEMTKIVVYKLMPSKCAAGNNFYFKFDWL